MLSVGTVVIGVHDLHRAVAFWTQALKYVPKREVQPDGDFMSGSWTRSWPRHAPSTRCQRDTPYVAQNTSNRRSAIDRRTTGHAGYDVSQRIRKRVEEPFGWVKTVGQGRKLRYIGQERNRAWFKMTTAVYNLIRITALDAATT